MKMGRRIKCFCSAEKCSEWITIEKHEAGSNDDA